MHFEKTLRNRRMDLEEGSESRFWPFFAKWFRNKNGTALEEAIREASEEGELKDDEGIMLRNVLRLGRKQVQDIMIPRPDIACAEIESTIKEIVDLIIKCGHSRIPIYQENRDNIIGIIHAKDLLKYWCEDRPLMEVQEVMRTPFFIPETKNVKDMLQEFRSRKNHLAIALDEYGGTSGLITIEDVLEEIVGEIEDEYDEPRPEEIQVLEGEEALVSGRTHLEDLEVEMCIRLDSELVDTLGGYLTEMAGHVPQAGEQFSFAGHRFTVKEADARQIKLIHVAPVHE